MPVDPFLPESPLTLTVSATFTAESIRNTLAFWMRQLSWNGEIRFALYRQVFQQLLDPTGLAATNRHGANVVLVRLEDWAAAGEEELRQHVERFLDALGSAARTFAAPLVVVICPASPGFPVQIQREMEERIAAAAGAWDTVHVITPAEIAALYPVADPSSPHGDELGHVPYTPLFFCALGTMVMRRIHALRLRPYKVIALDCDDTLWSGVCGEDGPQGVTIGPERRALQEFMLAQHDAGKLLCLVSKNNPEDVQDTFALQPGMVLRPEHFAGQRINWNSKAVNLQELAEELSLGLDGFILLDDSAKECSEVEANCPDVLALTLPPEAEIPAFLRHVWAFDSAKVTEEDRRRNQLYAEERERGRAQAEAPSLEAFLESLQLVVEITPLAPGELRRAAQLTERTNQMNVTTRRRSEAEIQALVASGDLECRTVHVSDRFGAYGLTGLMLYRVEDRALVVDMFLLSCRALGRGVEHRMLRELGSIAQAKGLETVELPFVRTARNRPALLFLEEIGLEFRDTGGDAPRFRFPTAYAAALVYRPGQARRQAPAERAPAARQGGRKSVPYARIAGEWREPEKILASVLGSTRGRPPLRTAYAEPRTDLERRIAGIWTHRLGIHPVGVNDDFFDLGGHSLLAVELMAELRSELGASLSMELVYSGSFTVAETAKAIELSQIAESGGDDYAALLAEIEGMSDEEVRELLAREGGSCESC